MGFRSTVVIAIDKKALFKQTLLLNNKIPELFHKDACNKIDETDEAKYFFFSDFKWYDSYRDIRDVEDFLMLFEDEEYGKTTLNEDNTMEQAGTPWDFGLEVQVILNTPFGEY